tara:strand:- start:175 stop:459 length:285 start_codon:yes stop_codon:yes gene_type:complete
MVLKRSFYFLKATVYGKVKVIHDCSGFQTQAEKLDSIAYGISVRAAKIFGVGGIARISVGVVVDYLAFVTEVGRKIHFFLRFADPISGQVGQRQ